MLLSLDKLQEMILRDVHIAPGMHDDGRALSLHEQVVTGFSVEEAEAQLALVGLSSASLSEITGRDARTIRAKSEKGQRLDRRDTAELVETIRLHQYALAVLGQHAYVTEWFANPHPALGDAAPLEVARDAYGRSLVRDILGRIEHGVFG